MKKHVLHLSVSNLSIIFATEWHDICTFKHRWPIREFNKQVQIYLISS